MKPTSRGFFLFSLGCAVGLRLERALRERLAFADHPERLGSGGFDRAGLVDSATSRRWVSHFA